MLPAIIAIGVWVIAIVLILLLWDFLKIRHQLDRVEHDLRIIDNTLARLSKVLLHPASKVVFSKNMEY